MTRALPNTLETILVVDDNPAVLRTVEAVLAFAGFVTITAGSAEDALRLAPRLQGIIVTTVAVSSMPCSIHHLLQNIDS